MNLLYGTRFCTRSLPQGGGEPARGNRKLVDHRHRLPLKRVREDSATGDDDEQHQRRAESARHMKRVQAIDGRIEGVEQQCGQNKRKQHRLHELQE